MDNNPKLPRVLIFDDGTHTAPTLGSSLRKLSADLRVQIVAQEWSEDASEEIHHTRLKQTALDKFALELQKVEDNIKGALRDCSKAILSELYAPPNHPYYQTLKPGRKGKKRHY